MSFRELSSLLPEKETRNCLYIPEQYGRLPHNAQPIPACPQIISIISLGVSSCTMGVINLIMLSIPGTEPRDCSTAFDVTLTFCIWSVCSLALSCFCCQQIKTERQKNYFRTLVAFSFCMSAVGVVANTIALLIRREVCNRH